jgi:subtilisin family serine protease
MNRKVFAVVLGILVFSLIAVSAEQGVATIHVQTFGYEGRDVVTLNVKVTGENADYLYIAIDAEVLDKIKKEINIEKLPVVKVNEVMFKIPKIYLREVRANEYVIVVPNNVTKMKWCIRDKIKGMNGNDVVDALVWFKIPGVANKVSKFGNVTYEFLSGMGCVVEIRVSKIKPLSEVGDVMFVEEDGVRHITLSDSISLINADDCWSAGYDGTGIKVCIIDTGVDANHCDFPSGKIVGWKDCVGSGSSPYDDHGHGTHCASIATGEDSPKGVAPGADLMAAKVCTSGGSCSDSAIICGIDWGVANGADVESLSIGGPGGDGTSAIAQECNWAVDQGVGVVCAAGNDGSSPYTINTPGDAEKVITVGATNKSDELAGFSSRGPTTDERMKPEVVAPGVSICAADNGTPCDVIGMSGTSQAAAHVAGVAALMLDANSSATPLDIKSCICATAIDMGDPGWDPDTGWGRVDAYAAVTCILSSHVVTITNPSDGSDVYSNGMINITASTSGDINKVKFYIIYINSNDEPEEVFHCEDTTPPFQCSWDPTGLPVGKWYTIRADGYICSQIKDVDEITVRLCSSSPALHPIRIINSSYGEGLGTILLALLVVFGFTGIITRKHIQKSMNHIRKVTLSDGKKATALTLTMLLSLNISAALSSTDTFSVEYQFTPAPLEGCGPWMVEDTQTREIPGEPLIPYKAAQILLPQGTVIKDIKVKTSNPIVQTGIDIPWGQSPCTFSDEPVMVGKNEKIYNTDKVYPDTLYEVVGVGSFRGFQILNVHLFPVQYKPKSQTVYFYETLTVQVKTGKGLKNTLYRGLPSDKQDVCNMVDNLEMISTYEDGPIPLATEEYIIITNDTLSSTFQALADWKSCYVNGTGVYTVSWIYSNYTGIDNQEKIRNFIKDWYTNHGTKYVLLGGDVDVVPFREFYVYVPPYPPDDVAADMYYAHLDGTFNDDSDSKWAEPNDGVDWYAEVAVGRAPVDNTAEAQAFVDKVIAYEQMPKPKRVCLHQARLQSGNSPDSRCLAYNCDDWVPGDYTIDYLFEENGTVTKTKWRDAWAANPVAVAHMGHGSTAVYHINYQVGGTVTWYCSDVASLTNTFWPWTTSVADHVGKIEYNDCLAECYVKDPDNGAIAAIYNDNYGWYSYSDACMYSGEFCEMEFRACFDDGKEKFGDMLNQSRYYMAGSASSSSTYRWCFYERNLVGDPESPCLTRRIPTVTITNPSDGSTVSETVTITTSTSECIDTVKFYIIGINNGEVFGELLCTDTTPPFGCSWNTDCHVAGWYTIRADGYNVGNVTDIDEITVFVDSSYLFITNPSNGATVDGTVTVVAETNYIDTVKFYIDGVLEYTDDTGPFGYNWDTTAYSDGNHTIIAKGYESGMFICGDQITCTVNNGGGGLGTTLLALFLLFGSLGVLKRQK